MCNHEEANPGIVLYALNITQRNLFSELVISFFGTGVLLMLLQYVEDICISTVFETRNKKNHLRVVSKDLGKTFSKALLPGVTRKRNI